MSLILNSNGDEIVVFNEHVDNFLDGLLLLR